MTKKKSPFLWKAKALQRISEPGYYVSIACTLSEHLKARPEVSPQATEDRGMDETIEIRQSDVRGHYMPALPPYISSSAKRRIPVHADIDSD